jgi:EmrB/QacA subfamily drug resistance transporter
VLALSAIVGAQLMLLLDVTVVNVAIPGIADDLGFSTTGRSWVLNVYILAFGGLLLLGSRIGDLIGRRTALQAGVAAFTLASVVGGLATGPAWLLAARGLQGASAALAAPSTLALIATTFREGTERQRALSVFSAVSGAGSSIGLILGGVLTEWGSWRWIFFINIPVGAAVLLLAPRYIAETEKHRGGRFDISGAITGTLGIASLVYAFIRVADRGWGDRQVIAAFTVAVLLLASFLLNEVRVERPLVVLRLFADRSRVIAYSCWFLLPAGMFGIFYFVTQYMETVSGFSPLRTGAAFLPMTVLLFAAARTAPRAIARFGAKRTAFCGLLVGLSGMLWFASLHTGESYAAGIAGPLALVGLGLGFVTMPLTTLILSGVEPRDAGSASGLLQTFQQIGGTLGLSVQVTVFGTVVRHGGSDAFAHGVIAALGTAAGFAVLALLLLLLMGTRRPATS